MSNANLEAIRSALASGGPVAAADELIDSLTQREDYDRLFDALLIRSRLDLGLPVLKPPSFDDVPEEKRPAFEAAYIAAARKVGQAFLSNGKLARAWAYFRTIREPQPIAEALEKVDPAGIDYEQTNELIEIALHDGANRVAGLRILLGSHGTCNTVTMMDQVLPTMTPDERRRAAAMLVRDIYENLTANVKRDVETRITGSSSPDNLRELIAGRELLFENGNYHIDVSHLHSVVRFARALMLGDAELPMAIELAEYGARLDPQFRYPADTPFDDYYRAHLAYLKAVAGTDRTHSLDYFRNRLTEEKDPRDRQVIAYVLVDLLMRCEQVSEAVVMASEHLPDLEEPGGFSYSALCGKANRLDLLETAAERAGDPVRFATALIEQARA